MSHNNRKDSNGQTLADRLTAEYSVWISEEIYKKYGIGKNQALTDNMGRVRPLRDQQMLWRVCFAWSNEMEQFIIEKTKTYIRLLDNGDSNMTNLRFLRALTNRMAVYLSGWAVNAPHRTFSDATKIFTDALYDNSSYVRGVELRQAAKQVIKEQRSKNFVTNQRKREKIAAKKKNRDISRQVHVIFIEVSKYRSR